MPTKKRRFPSPPSKPHGDVADSTSDATTGGGGGGGRGGRLPLPSRGAARPRLTDPEPRGGLEDDSDAEGDGGADDGDSESSQSDDGGTDEFVDFGIFDVLHGLKPGHVVRLLSRVVGIGCRFVLVKLAEIRKEVQCPICLGIIRKTRTVMECLHRFCRDCIDKSMRLGNNECPACRTHCASRRSLRDDPKYDALIAALYPDIDKYEEEEFAFSEQERIRNKKIQEAIEETLQRQSEAIGKKRSMAKATATALKYRRTRGRAKTITPDIAPTGSAEEDREEENAKETTREQSSADDHSPDLRQKRCRKRSGPHGSPAGTIGSIDHGFGENGELVGGKEILATSPLRGEMLAWGKNGTRSQNRHGSVVSNGRTGRSGRIAKLVDHLHTADEMDKEFQLYLVLLPVDGQTIPNLEKPYLSCRPTLSIKHLAQFVALQLSWKVEELEMYIRMDRHRVSVGSKSSSAGEANQSPFDGLERLREDKLLSELHPSFTSSNGNMELRYALKTRD